MSRTQVAIVGAGPAGLLLAALLAQRDIDTVVLEARDRAYVEARQRAGILEQGTTDLLEELGVAARMHAEGFAHDGIRLVGDGEAHRVDLRALTGRRVTLWPQTEVVKDLIAARLAAGLALHFGVTDVALHGVDGDRPRVTYVDADGEPAELDCDVIAGCDGFHGTCREQIPEAELHVATRDYPFAWLGILADVEPSCDELIYASSARGFALASMRTPTVSRLYVQVDPAESLDAWPDDRIWEELALRLAHDGFALQDGPVTEKAILPMRSWVTRPMRHGRLVLAGDAAHIVPPTGAKGLNLAAADVRVLAETLEAHFGGDRAALGGYTERALQRVWRAEHFSWWMTTMLHRDPEADAFDLELQRSQLRYVFTSEAAQTTLAENYTGSPVSTDQEHAAGGEPALWTPTDDTPTSYVRPPASELALRDHPPYKSTQLRHPKQPLIRLPHTATEVTGPQLASERVLDPRDADLTAQHAGAPIGERLVVLGRVMDTEGQAAAGTLVEVWQSNAAGRYAHKWDQWDAPLDPNFSGAGRCLTDDDGAFRFVTVKPGPYPWGNHYNAWRPAHIHFSLLGRAFAQRLVTQMYFPGDPWFPYDPLFNGVRDPAARQRMIAAFSVHDCVPNWAQAYRFDIVLRGPGATPFEEAHG